MGRHPRGRLLFQNYAQLPGRATALPAIRTQNMENSHIRASLLARGQVQGVGFRPFVYRLAVSLGLTGSVGNTSEGVRIEIQGPRGAVAAFRDRFPAELPPLARLTGLSFREIPLLPDETGFTIARSTGHRGHSVLISPDVGVCGDCLRDMRDPGNRRYRYPFTSCTNCGPRYTITRSIPYDRATTSMACFPLCPDCSREYTDPLDRRFDAQPIACPACGPRLWFLSCRDGVLPEVTACTEENSRDPIARAVAALLEGRIVALRGIGGFQLACDASDEAAVSRLRRRKHRPHKAFALMAADTGHAETAAFISGAEAALLTSPARPAVVLGKRKGAPLAPSVAPDTATAGIMLPTSPLHAVLFDLLAEACSQKGRPVPLLVMTSGNVTGDPICLGNREALRRLSGTADAFLLHDRDILCRVDDSVTALFPRTVPAPPADILYFRRARGYVPAPVSLSHADDTRPVLGCGAGLKATVCITRGDSAFVGQHTGDLGNAAAAGFYEETARHLMDLLEVVPGLIVRDLHPDFFSSRFGEDLAGKLGVPCVALQHHAAHAASVLAENNYMAPALALTLDGTGLGTDGTVWGGELLFMDPGQPAFTRAGSLSPFPLPGGDQATRFPWRIALSLDLASRGADAVPFWRERQGMAADAVAEMLARRVNSPLTSSCGRLFDAVSALLGLCQETSYEGQAAIRLETAALGARRTSLPGRLPDITAEQAGGRLQISSAALFRRAKALSDSGADTGTAALGFHLSLAAAFTDMAEKAAQTYGTRTIALTGGVMQNRIMAGELVRLLSERGFTVLTNRDVPAGDGGLSLGQATWGRWLLETGKY